VTPAEGLTRAEAIELQTSIKRAYQLAFNNPGAGAAVMFDLGIFCRANDNTAVPGDHDRTWALIGRREVWLRIRDYLDLTPEQLVEKYHPPA